MWQDSLNPRMYAICYRLWTSFINLIFRLNSSQTSFNRPKTHTIHQEEKEVLRHNGGLVRCIPKTGEPLSTCWNGVQLLLLVWNPIVLEFPVQPLCSCPMNTLGISECCIVIWTKKKDSSVSWAWSPMSMPWYDSVETWFEFETWHELECVPNIDDCTALPRSNIFPFVGLGYVYLETPISVE